MSENMRPEGPPGRGQISGGIEGTGKQKPPIISDSAKTPLGDNFDYSWRMNRRTFVKVAAVTTTATALGLPLVGCEGGAVVQQTLTPADGGTPPKDPAVSTTVATGQPPVEATETLPLETINIQFVVPAFTNAKNQLSAVGQAQNVQSFDGEASLQAMKITPTHGGNKFWFDHISRSGAPDSRDIENPNPTQVEFTGTDTVYVELPFGSGFNEDGTIARPVETNGMFFIPDPNADSTRTFIRTTFGLKETDVIFFAEGSEGSPLRGMGLMWGVKEKPDAEIKEWVFMPWLTQKGIAAKIVNEKGVATVSYTDQTTKKEVGKVELSKLLIKLDKDKVVEVTSDGRYVIGSSDLSKPRNSMSSLWRANGVPENIITFHDQLFFQPSIAEPWSSDKVQDDVFAFNPKTMYGITGQGDYGLSNYLDFSLGTMRIAYKQDENLLPNTDYEGLRASVGQQFSEMLKSEKNKILKDQLLRVRTNLAKLNELKDKGDFREVFMVIGKEGVKEVAIQVSESLYHKYSVDSEGNLALLGEVLPYRTERSVFEDNFNNGLKFSQRVSDNDGWWTTLTKYGAEIQVKPVSEIFPDQESAWVDSEGNQRGNVMVATVTGEPVEVPSFGPGYWYHSIAAWLNNDFNVHQTLAAPIKIGCDVKISQRLGYMSLLSAHRIDRSGQSTKSVIGMEIDEWGNLILVARDTQGKDKRVTCNRAFDKSDWFRVELILEQDGRVVPLVNGEVAIVDPLQAPKVTVDENNPAGISDAHAGLLTASEKKRIIPKGEYVLNDNFRVSVLDV